MPATPFLMLRVARTSLILIALCLLFVPIYCAEARVENVSIQREFRDADSVLLVEVDQEDRLNVRGISCGTRYRAIVKEVFKTSFGINNGHIIFGRHEGLIPGRRYLLFLKYIADPSEYYDTIRQQTDLPDETLTQKEHTIELVKCGNIVPGFIYRTRAAWEVKLSYVVVEGVRPDMPDSIRAWSPEPLQWLISRDDLFLYLRTLTSKRK